MKTVSHRFSRYLAAIVFIGALGMAPHAAQAIPSDNPYSGDEKVIAAGHLLYNKHCHGCHGWRLNGKSRFPAADLTVFDKGFRLFVSIVKSGKQGKIGIMPRWKGIITEDEIAIIGTYVETYATAEAKWTND